MRLVLVLSLFSTVIAHADKPVFSGFNSNAGKAERAYGKLAPAQRQRVAALLSSSRNLDAKARKIHDREPAILVTTSGGFVLGPSTMSSTSISIRDLADSKREAASSILGVELAPVKRTSRGNPWAEANEYKDRAIEALEKSGKPMLTNAQLEKAMKR